MKSFTIAVLSVIFFGSLSLKPMDDWRSYRPQQGYSRELEERERELKKRWERAKQRERENIRKIEKRIAKSKEEIRKSEKNLRIMELEQEFIGQLPAKKRR